MRPLERKTNIESRRISIDYQSFPKERLLCTTIRPLSKHSDLQSVARVVPTPQR